MGWWLADARRGQAEGVLSRFDPAYWTVNFPRPMMASVTTTAPDALRVDAVFYRQDDLAGLVWDAEDRHDHPLLRYETVRDFRDCRLRFRWRSQGVRPLDGIHGPVLTIEGRDAAGNPRAWYVRLWNYAEGSPEDALVSIDFAQLQGGYDLPGEADPVWAGDVDRMFVSLVAPGYSGVDADLAAPAEGWVELSGIACDGPGSVLAVGDVIMPEHGLCIANGYDDNYHLTPERLLRNIVQLGWRGTILHYVGMSHYFRLEANSGGHYVSLGATALNVACRAWHADFAAQASALGYELILSLSYELLDQHVWDDWKQRAADGSPALTGWAPPSTLLSPAHPGAMAYLQAVAREFARIAQAAGLRVRFQIGEPWWWTLPDGSLCIHDTAAQVALAGAGDVEEAAGALLAASTLALRDAVRSVAADAETLLLVYAPTALVQPKANVPIGWARPAFDVLQLEDYDWAAAGNAAASARGIAAIEARLGYPVEDQHYLAGFVLRPEDRWQWQHVAAATGRARRRGVAQTYVWALPQVLRDGFVHFETEETMDAFDDVLFPLALGREAEVAPEVSTSIVASAGGREKRNAEWAEARTRYDVGPGLRSEADIMELLAFFRARMGPARGFRLRDPFDCVAVDELIGFGDGANMRFPLARRYGGVVRRITRPVAATLQVMIDGMETEDFVLEEGGVVTLGMAPAKDVAVSATFVFDVPVRFAEDQLRVSRATFQAGALASVPLVEIRE